LKFVKNIFEELTSDSLCQSLKNPTKKFVEYKKNVFTIAFYFTSGCAGI
jgi:hypothetical protein